MPRTSDKAERQDARRRFERELAETGDYRRACERAGISERTGRRWRATALRASAPVRLAGSKTHDTGFFGRDSELAELSRRFETGTRLVTVLGTAGMGKTRLASKWASERAESMFGSEIVRCDLRQVATAEGLTSALGRELGVRLEETPEGSDDSVGTALAARGPILVFLDNFEQLVDQGADRIAAWLRIAPRACFLVTSRVVLRLAEEVAMQLAPLGCPSSGEHESAIADFDAVRLFQCRAVDIEPTFREREIPLRQVAELVQLLEGIPLAIELAAAQLRRVGVVELLAEVKASSLSLVSPIKNIEPDHATLSSALDRSWRLLGEDDRRLLARLAVFRGGFCTVAVAAVDRDEASRVAERLACLREASLVRVVDGAGGDRRWDLFEAVREYADLRLDERGDRAAAERNHARFFVEAGIERVGELAGPNAEASRGWMVTELGNLEQAFRWHLTHGSPNERVQIGSVLCAAFETWQPGRAAQFAERALEAGLEATDVVSKVRLRIACGNAHREAGAFDEAEAALSRARGELDKIGASTAFVGEEARALESEAALQGGMLALFRGRPHQAREQLERAFAIVQESGNPHLEGRVHTALGWVLGEAFRDPVAFDHHSKAVRLLEGAGDPYAASSARLVRAVHKVLYQRGDPESELICEAETMRRLHGSSSQADAWVGLAGHFLDHGRIEEAVDAGEHILRLSARSGSQKRQTTAAFAVGPSRDESGDLEEARVVYEDAIAQSQRLGDLRWEGLATVYLAGLVARAREVDLAEVLLETAGDRIAESGDPRLQDLVKMQRGQVELARALLCMRVGNIGEATRLAGAARARLQGALQSDDATPPIAECSPEARHLLRVLKRELDRHGTHRWCFAVARDGSRFHTGTGAGRRVSDGEVIRRVLVALVKERIRAPGTLLRTNDLVEKAWPGEKMRAESGKRRVRDLIVRLRRAGLDGLLITGDNGGYCLDPEVPTRFEDSDPAAYSVDDLAAS